MIALSGCPAFGLSLVTAIVKPAGKSLESTIFPSCNDSKLRIRALAGAAQLSAKASATEEKMRVRGAELRRWDAKMNEATKPTRRRDVRSGIGSPPRDSLRARRMGGR